MVLPAISELTTMKRERPFGINPPANAAKLILIVVRVVVDYGRVVDSWPTPVAPFL